MIAMRGVMLAQSIVGIRRMYFGIGMKKTVVALGRRSRKELQDGSEKIGRIGCGGLSLRDGARNGNQYYRYCWGCA